LTAIVSDDEAATLISLLGEKPGRTVSVDLERQTIQCGDQSFRFAIDPVRRTRLLNGWDNIALTESYMDEIAAFKRADRARRAGATPAQPQGCVAGPARPVRGRSHAGAAASAPCQLAQAAAAAVQRRLHGRNAHIHDAPTVVLDAHGAKQ